MYYKKYQSSYCTLIMISDGEYLTGLYFDSYCDIREYNEANLDVFDETIKWLDCYFEKTVPSFLPKMKLIGTDFQKEVWKILLSIPYGKSMTYGDIASIVASKRGTNKMSSQAVGQAISKNPICIIVPCHRVLGKNNTLTGYAFGLENKKILLELEDIL